jgi:hypothetical protein
LHHFGLCSWTAERPVSTSFNQSFLWTYLIHVDALLDLFFTIF